MADIIKQRRRCSTPRRKGDGVRNAFILIKHSSIIVIMPLT